MGLAQPRILVTAEEVEVGKPDPGCYRLGAERVGVLEGGAGREVGGGHGDEGARGQGQRILVLEDAPAGVRAGKAAGFEVVALATSHSVEQLREAGADWIVRDMRSVKFVHWDGKVMEITIEIADALVV